MPGLHNVTNHWHRLDTVCQVQCLVIIIWAQCSLSVCTDNKSCKLIYIIRGFSLLMLSVVIFLLVKYKIMHWFHCLPLYGSALLGEIIRSVFFLFSQGTKKNRYNTFRKLRLLFCILLKSYESSIMTHINGNKIMR